MFIITAVIFELLVAAEKNVQDTLYDNWFDLLLMSLCYWWGCLKAIFIILFTLAGGSLIDSVNE